MKGLILIIIMGLKTTQAGIDLIKFFEGFRSQAYLCPASILTIGYGHTGKDIYPNMVITEKEAEELLKKDLERFEKYVNNSVKRILIWNQFDAIVSFSYNTGYRIKGNLQKSINENNVRTTVYIMSQYNKANINGKLIVLKGLIKRREAETFLYSTGDKETLYKKYLMKS